MAINQVVVALLIPMMSFYGLLNVCVGHLVNPASRSTLWKRGVQLPYAIVNNDPYCGGNSREELLVSGQHFRKGYISGTYCQGDRATFEIDESQLEPGYMEFKICSANSLEVTETQECFNEHPVYLADGSGTRFQILEGKKIAKVDVKIPQNIECNFCVLQYHFHSGYEAPPAKAKTTCPTCWQRDIYGCSDIVITHNHPDHPAPSSGIQGIIVKGPGNFGNIIGNGAISSGTNNAWSNVNSNGHFTGFNGQAGSQQNGGQAPLINGILVKGSGNFGNILGPGAISTGTNNAWSNVNTGSSPVFIPIPNPPRPNPPSPFPYPYGPTVSPTVTCANIICRTQPPVENINTQTTSTLSIALLVALLQRIAQANQQGSVQIQVTFPIQSVTPCNQPTIPGCPPVNYPIYGPEVTPQFPGNTIGGIRVNGKANFGNILGPGSVSTGTNNAWSKVNTQSVHHRSAADEGTL